VTAFPRTVTLSKVMRGAISLPLAVVIETFLRTFAGA
jgi:hypothetical protein